MVFFRLKTLTPPLIFWSRDKSHGAGSGEYGGSSNTEILFRQKLLDRHRFVYWCVALVKNPWAVSLHFRSFSTYTSTMSYQNLRIIHIGSEILFYRPFIAEAIWKYMDRKTQGCTFSTNTNFSFFQSIICINIT